MNKPMNKETLVLETKLKKAYQARKPVAVDAQWTAQVMRAIRMRGPLGKSSVLESFGRFVWKLAPVSVILIVVMAACTLSVNVVPEYEMAHYFIDNPVDFTLIESLGI